MSSRTESRAFSFPPHFGGRGTQRGICFFALARHDLAQVGRAGLQPLKPRFSFVAEYLPTSAVGAA